MSKSTPLDGFITLTILVILAFMFCFGCNRPSTGRKVGQIVKVSQSGLINKTWEAEIIHGGLNAGSGALGNSFHFTIADDATAKKAEEFMEKQTEVMLNYRTEGLYLKMRTENHGSFASSIEPAKSP